MPRIPSRASIDAQIERVNFLTYVADVAASCSKFAAKTSMALERIWAQSDLIANDLPRLVMLRDALKSLSKWASDQASKFDGDIGLILSTLTDKKATVRVGDQYLNVRFSSGRITKTFDDVKVKEFMVSKGIPPKEVTKIWEAATKTSVGQPFIEVRKVSGENAPLDYLST